jgi:hypothetical protein
LVLVEGHMKMKPFVLVPALLLFGLAGAGLAGVPVGDPSPDFTLPDVNGNMHSLSDFTGKVVLLNFWQST